MRIEKENWFTWIMRIVFLFAVIFSLFIMFSAITNALEFKLNTNYCNWINGNYQSCNISVGFHSSTNSTLYSGYLCSYTDYYSNGTRLTAYVNMTETGNTSIYNYNFTGRGDLGLYNSLVNCTSNIENATSFNSYWVVSELTSRNIANISDYSKIINDTASRIEKNVSNINSWNNAIIKSNIQIYGTEYSYNENATIYAQVTNSTGGYVNTASCNITMYYQNLTFFRNETAMNFTNGSKGLYRHNFITPYAEGDFAVLVSCLSPEVYGISKIHIGKWANSIMVGLNNTLNLFDCDTITGNNDVCERLNKIIDTANDTLFYSKLSTPSYLMNIYKIDSNEIGYPYAYRLELSPRGNSDPTIFLKVPVNSSSDILLRNNLLDLTSFTLTQDVMGENWINFKSTGLGCDKTDLNSHLECMFKNYYVYLRNPLYLRNDTIADLKPQSYLDITLERFSTAEKKIIPNYNFDGYLIFSVIIFGVIIFLLIIIFALAWDKVKIQRD